MANPNLQPGAKPFQTYLAAPAEPGLSGPGSEHWRGGKPMAYCAALPAGALAHLQQEPDAFSQLLSALQTAERRCLRLQAQVLMTQAALLQAQAEAARWQAGERVALHQAAHDSLTDLPNRRHLQAQLQRHARAPATQPTLGAVMLLDLDGFKAINDRQGHAAGDQVLRIVAARLRHAVRADDCVCRHGGDEFVCLLTQHPSAARTGIDAPRALACKLFEAVSAPMLLGQLQVSVRPSIGVALLPDGDWTAKTLLDAADSAMYHAKRSGAGWAFHGKQGGAGCAGAFALCTSGSSAPVVPAGRGNCANDDDATSQP